MEVINTSAIGVQLPNKGYRGRTAIYAGCFASLQNKEKRLNSLENEIIISSTLFVGFNLFVILIR